MTTGYEGMTDGEILALRLQRLRDDIARKNQRQSGSLETAVMQAEAEIRKRAPGFNTLTPNMKRITALRRAITDLGATPVGAAFPGPRDEDPTIAVLEEQLLNLQLGTQPSRALTRTAPGLNDRAALADDPSNAPTETFGADYIADSTPIPADTQPAGSGAYTKEMEIERRANYAVRDARKELEEGATPLDQYNAREQQIMALYDAIRARGEAPDVARNVARGEETTAILRLTRQLRSIIEKELTPTRSDAVGETDRASGITPEEASWIETSNTSFSRDADPALARDFDEHGFNRSFGSTDMASEVMPDSQSSRSAQEPRPEKLPHEMTVIEAYKEIRDFFPPGELDGLLINLITVPEFNDWGVAEQTAFFLQQVVDSAALPGLPPEGPEKDIPRMLRQIEEWTPRNGKLEFRDLGMLDYNDVLRFATTQWIPDSIAEDLPDPIRIPIQAALNLTEPLNIALLLSGGGSLAALGRGVLGELIGGTLGQIAEEAGAPVWVQILAEVAGGGFGEISPEIAAGGARSIGRAKDEFIDEWDEALYEDHPKFKQLLDEGRYSEAFKAAGANIIDDIGDVAQAAEIEQYFDEVAQAARDQGLTEAQYWRTELAKEAFKLAVESAIRPDQQGPFSTQFREPFPFGLIIDNTMVSHLATRITEGTGLDTEQQSDALSGLDNVLSGNEPSPQEFAALEIAFGQDFTGRVLDAADAQLLRPYMSR